MGSMTTQPAPPQVAFMGPIDEAIARMLPGVIAALPTVEERFMTPKEVAEEFGFSLDTVYRLIKQNKIPHTGKTYGDPKVIRSEFIEQARQIARANVTQ